MKWNEYELDFIRKHSALIEKEDLLSLMKAEDWEGFSFRISITIAALSVKNYFILYHNLDEDSYELEMLGQGLADGWDILEVFDNLKKDNLLDENIVLRIKTKAMANLEERG